jgi:hypothetical protein
MGAFQGFSVLIGPIRRLATSVTYFTRLWSGVCIVARLPFDRAPSLHTLRPRSSRACSRFHRYYEPVRLLVCSPTASSPRLPVAARSPRRLRAKRGLPGTDVVCLHVMESATAARRQRLAYRRRTCCLRRCSTSRPLRLSGFRGSIVHPTQSLCTLRGRRRRRAHATLTTGRPLRPTRAGLSPARRRQLTGAQAIQGPLHHLGFRVGRTLTA